MRTIKQTIVLPAVMLLAILGCDHRHVATSDDSEAAVTPNVTEPGTRKAWLSLRVGMTREQVLASSQLQAVVPNDQVTEEHRHNGCIIRPADADLQSDTWTIVHLEPFVAEGGHTSAELTFADGKLVRIKIVEEVH